MIRIRTRVDDVADGQRRNRLDRREDLVAHGRFVGVDDEERIRADLDGDVAAGAGEHVDAALHRQDLDLALVLVGGPIGTREVFCRPALRRRRKFSRTRVRDHESRALLQLLDVFRVERVLASERRGERQLVVVGVLGMRRAQRIVRHIALAKPRNFLGHVHLRDGVLARPRVQAERRRADHRLFEVDRVVYLRDEHHAIAVTDEVLVHHGVRADRNPVPLNEHLLEVRGRHVQHPVFPLTGRETGPQVLRRVGGMRPSVEPDRAVRVLEEAGERVRDQPAADRVDDLADVRARVRSAHRVRAGVRPRLMLGNRLDRRVPRQRLLPRGGVQREAGEVSELRTRIDPDQPLLVVHHRPRSDELDLRRPGIGQAPEP